jgi:tetratricopeptide (TPR) repeat protein
LRHFEHLIVMKPNWPSSYYGASLAAFKLEKYEKSLKLVDNAIALSQSNFKDTVIVRENDKIQYNGSIYLKA